MVSSTNQVKNSIEQIVKGAELQTKEILDIVSILTNLKREIGMIQEKLTVITPNAVKVRL